MFHLKENANHSKSVSLVGRAGEVRILCVVENQVELYGQKDVKPFLSLSRTARAPLFIFASLDNDLKVTLMVIMPVERKTALMMGMDVTMILMRDDDDDNGYADVMMTMTTMVMMTMMIAMMTVMMMTTTMMMMMTGDADGVMMMTMVVVMLLLMMIMVMLMIMMMVVVVVVMMMLMMVVVGVALMMMIPSATHLGGVSFSVHQMFGAFLIGGAKMKVELSQFERPNQRPP